MGENNGENGNGKQEVVHRKDVLARIDTLTLMVVERLTRIDTVGENIVKRLDLLNGKVAEHEKRFSEMAIKDAVEATILESVKNKQDGHEEDGKRFKFITLQTLLGAIVGLITTAIVALITFYLTFNR